MMSVIKKMMISVLSGISKIYLKHRNRIFAIPNQTECDAFLDNIWKPSKVYSEHTFDHDVEEDSLIDLSVIIPLYNAEPFIRKCVDSLISQKTKYRYEIILVNDGSTDQTQKVMEEYSQKYPLLIQIVTQQNRGISVARNEGIAKARGKYIGFIDQDDWVKDQYIEILLNTAYKNNSDIVKCGYSDIDLKNQMRIWQNESIHIEKDEHEKFLHVNGYVWGGIFDRKLWRKVRFPEGYWYEDMIVRMLIFRQSKCFINIPDVLYIKRLHENNASIVLWKKSSPKSLEEYYLLKELYIECRKIGLSADSLEFRFALYEMGNMLFARIFSMKTKEKKFVFASVAHWISEIYRDEYIRTLSESEKFLLGAFVRYDYKAWKVASVYARMQVE